MDSDSNEVPDLQDPQPATSGLEEEVIELVPDPRGVNFVKPEPTVERTNAAAELDAMCRSLLPKTLTEFSSSSNLPIIGPSSSTKFHGPPNRRIPQTDWELFDHGGQTYLIIREEKNRGFVRQYVSVNGRTFECCYCMEKTGRSVTATATKGGEGKYVVIAAVDHVHSQDCPPIPYKFCIKFNHSENSVSMKSNSVKVKKTAMKAAQMGSIQSIIDTLTVPKPTLEYQEKSEVINGNPPTISAPKPKVKIFSINPTSCRIIPDEDWEYGLGIRGEPKGVIIVKVKKDKVREFRLLKASSDGKMREYYCTSCQHKYGRTIKVYVETSASGKETAKMLIAKPHADLCKGIPLNEAYEKQRAVEHRFAKQVTNSDSDIMTASPDCPDGKVPTYRWRFALSPDGVPNAALLVQVSGVTEIYREYRWVPEVSNVGASGHEMVYKCSFCEKKNKNVPALLNVSSGKISLSESPSSDHVESCVGLTLESLMMNQFLYGRKQLDKGSSLGNLQSLIQEVTQVNGTTKSGPVIVSDILTACLDLDTIPNERYSLIIDEEGKNRLIIIAEDDQNYGYEFNFWKNAGIAGKIFLCKGCQEVRKKTKAFIRESEEGITVQADQNHHSRCSSKSLT